MLLRVSKKDREVGKTPHKNNLLLGRYMKGVLELNSCTESLRKKLDGEYKLQKRRVNCKNEGLSETLGEVKELVVGIKTVNLEDGKVNIVYIILVQSNCSGTVDYRIYYGEKEVTLTENS